MYLPDLCATQPGLGRFHVRASGMYRRRANDVAAFLGAFRVLIGLMDEVRKPGGYSVTVMRPKAGCDEEVGRAGEQASKLAGRAIVAAKGIEPRMRVALPGREPMELYMVQSWRTSLDDPWMLDPASVISGVEQVVGALEAKADEAASRERTLAGRFAAFVSFPAAVRASVTEDYPGLGKAAYATGVVAQILVGVIIAVLSAGAIAGIAAAWSAAFDAPPNVAPISTPAP